MITVRPAAERGHVDLGWLDSHHSFSFGEYHDPRHMGFGPIRVINDDRVKAGQGFGAHPHRDMEIVSYVLDGALEHKDNTGSHGAITHGVVQRMSAGTGVVHSEFNGSQTEAVHFLQIWIVPEKRGAAPRYEDRAFAAEGRRNRWQLIVSPDGADGSLDVYQDARICATELEAGRSITRTLAPGRRAWIQVARGAVTLNGITLDEGDGAAVADEVMLTVSATSAAEVLLFDVA
jgi:redox-sensitive bicupin YhaK (pirin superfamily)